MGPGAFGYEMVTQLGAQAGSSGGKPRFHNSIVCAISRDQAKLASRTRQAHGAARCFEIAISD